MLNTYLYNGCSSQRSNLNGRTERICTGSGGSSRSSTGGLLGKPRCPRLNALLVLGALKEMATNRSKYDEN